MKLERFGRSSRRAGLDEPRILIFGDSHVHALQEALKARSGASIGVQVEARRLLKTKSDGGTVPARQSASERLRGFVSSILRDDHATPPRTGPRTLGDTTFTEFLRIARSLGEGDILASAVGGNQHAVYSTIQHPRPFDFDFPGDEPGSQSPGVEAIPFGPLFSHFEKALRNGDGATLAALKSSTRARVVHLVAPPPKRDSEFIERNHDTHFATEGIADLGVSSAALRMKFWKLQNRALVGICGDLGIEMLEPPAAACDGDGFLAEEYYARDATHANVAYGELVIAQLEQLSVGVAR
jgi:hypothetical protein